VNGSPVSRALRYTAASHLVCRAAATRRGHPSSPWRRSDNDVAGYSRLMGGQRRGTEVRLTHRWREMDSNLRSLLRGWVISAASMSFAGLGLKTVAHWRETIVRVHPPPAASPRDAGRGLKTTGWQHRADLQTPSRPATTPRLLVYGLSGLKAERQTIASRYICFGIEPEVRSCSPDANLVWLTSEVPTPCRLLRRPAGSACRQRRSALRCRCLNQVSPTSA
jgi:hypothetical protein